MNVVFFVGPLPPPLHGFSWVNSRVFELIKEKSDVVYFSRSPSSGILVTLFKYFLGIFNYIILLFVRRPQAVYIGWSGGFSMLVDSVYAFFALLLGVKLYVHHHSFAYLNAESLVNRISLGIAKKANHIVLCDLMAKILSDRYGVDSVRVVPVSNAAFLPKKNDILNLERGDKIVVGFLSNVTAAKGIFEFFDLAERFAANSDFKFMIAGPVSQDTHIEFNRRISLAGNVEHVGPVYEDKKFTFLRGLDIFVFPTKYINEAEPVSIAEALREGLPVISISRGCISSMLGDTGVLTSQEGFIGDAEFFLNQMALDVDFYKAQRMKAAEQFEKLRFESSGRLRAIVDQLAGK